MKEHKNEQANGRMDGSIVSEKRSEKRTNGWIEWINDRKNERTRITNDLINEWLND